MLKSNLIWIKVFTTCLNVFLSTELRYQMKNVNLHIFFLHFFSFIVCICFKFKEKLIFKNQNHVFFFGFLWCPSLMSSPELCTGEDINLGHSPVQ